MNAEEMFDGEVIRATYIVEFDKESGITTWMYIPEEKKEKDMKQTNLEHYKEDLKEILKYHFDSPRAVIKLIREKFGCQIKVEKYSIDAILEWMAQPYREPILDDVEREYLSEVIRPFRKKVRYISKKGICSKEFILIEVEENCSIALPSFKAGSMYKGMEPEKQYNLKELGLC